MPIEKGYIQSRNEFDPIFNMAPALSCVKGRPTLVSSSVMAKPCRLGQTPTVSPPDSESDKGSHPFGLMESVLISRIWRGKNITEQDVGWDLQQTLVWLGKSTGSADLAAEFMADLEPQSKVVESFHIKRDILKLLGNLSPADENAKWQHQFEESK